MSVRFYNPGSRIHEMLTFDHPTNDVKEQNLISYFALDAEPGSFFEVPSEVEVQLEDGETRAVPVNFGKRITADFAKLGVVLIDPKRNTKKHPIGSEENVATNDKDAKIRAQELWEEAMYRLVREHEENCIKLRDNGHKPKRAFGNVAHALKTLGIEDPANDVEDVVRRKQDVSEVAQLKAQLAEMQTMILNLATKGK
jgi:hypothetical protein